MSALVVGVPSEIKNNENRVSVQPDGVAELVHHGHQVLVQSGAGAGSRFPDEEYVAAVRQLDDAVGGERHPLLVVLDLVRYPDDERAHAGISWFEK